MKKYINNIKHYFKNKNIKNVYHYNASYNRFEMFCCICVFSYDKTNDSIKTDTIRPVHEITIKRLDICVFSVVKKNEKLICVAELLFLIWKKT